MAKYDGKLGELVELLNDLDRVERIEVLIGIADRFREVSPEIARRPYGDDHKVPACESEAYLWAMKRADGTLDFHFAVENPQGISAKAMAVILDENLSGAALTTVAGVDAEVVYDIFGRELSMGKSMGLMGMVSMVATSARRLLDGPATATTPAEATP